MRKYLFIIIIQIIISSCNNNDKNSTIRSYQRNNKVDVKQFVEEIPINEIISRYNHLYIMNDYLIITDSKPVDKIIHIFDKKDYNHISSVSEQGRGPGEITSVGSIGIDEVNNKFYLIDHGRYDLLSYSLDSVLVNADYKPEVKIKLDTKQFFNRFQYFNDTLMIGQAILPIGVSSFNQSTAKWNISTGEFKIMDNHCKVLEKIRLTVSANPKKNLYVEAYTHNDLISFCDMSGNLLFNIYGPEWSKENNIIMIYYNQVVFCRDKILISFSGKKYHSDNYLPNEIIVFNLNGDYLKTLDIGHLIKDFCYDNTNNKLILSLDSDIQFASLKLDDVLK